MNTTTTDWRNPRWQSPSAPGLARALAIWLCGAALFAFAAAAVYVGNSSDVSRGAGIAVPPR